MPYIPELATSDQYAYLYSRLLSTVNGTGTVENLSETWGSFEWGDAQFRYFPRTAGFPNAAAVDTGDNLLVFISGTDSLGQVLRYANPISVWGYALPYPDRNPSFGPNTPYRANSYFAGWGWTVATLIGQVPNIRSKRIQLVGHSYGGAVCSAAASYLHRFVPNNQVTAITFGAPKVADTQLFGNSKGARFVRWMNSGDPIPSLPPTEGELKFPVKLIDQVALFAILPPVRQYGDGRLITEDFVWNPAVSVTLTPSILELVAVRDLSYFNPSRFERHYLSTYCLTTLELVKRKSIVEGIRLDKLLPAREIIRLGLSVPNLLQADTIPAMRLAASTLSGISLVPAMPISVSPHVPNTYTVKVRKTGVGSYAVWWEGGMIATGTRSQCMSLARPLNKVLRRLMVQGEFKYDTFKVAFDIWVAEATAGGLGFRPNVANITYT